MTKLTNIEVELIDNYIIRNQFHTLDQAYFLNALSNTVPSWRAEQLASTDTVYSNTISPAFVDYLNTFDDKKYKML